MNHEQASLLVPDLATNRLDWDLAAEVRRHLAGCAECREALALHEAIRREVESAGAPLFTPHPSAEQIAELALSTRGDATPEFAEVREHARVCPTCRVEVASVRAAEAGARAPWSGTLGSLRIPGLSPSVPALVPALLVLFLAYPAYLGVVRLPEMRRQWSQANEELASLRDGAWEGGAVAALTLPAPERGGPDPHAPIPEARIRPGQAFQAIRIDFDPRSLPDSPVRVALAGPDGAESWGFLARPEELWDAGDEAIHLIVPVRKIAAGEYVIEIRDPATHVAAYQHRFRIVR